MAAGEIHGDVYIGKESPPEKAARAKRHQEKLATYLNHVKDRTKHLRLRGVPVRNAADLTIPLAHVYIQIQALEEEAAQEVRRREVEAALGHSDEEKDHSTRPRDLLSLITQLGEHFYRQGQTVDSSTRPAPVDPVAAVEKYQKVVLLGTPGAGKSTLMDYLAHRYAANAGLIPLPVSLGTYARELQRNATLSIRDAALREAASGDGELYAALDAQVEQENAIWLLDGLDEAYARNITVSERAASLPGKVVLTSRPVGYARAGRTAWKHFEVLPLSTANVDSFIVDWLRAMAYIDHRDESWIQARASNLQQQLAARPHLKPLTRTPLLLTFMVVLAGEQPDYQLPSNRAQLYQAYLERLYIIHEAERYPVDDLTQKRSIRFGARSQGTAQQVVLDSLNLLAYYPSSGLRGQG